MSIEKIKVNGRIYDIRDVEDVKKEETRAVAAEADLLQRLRGVSDKSDSRNDSFKFLGYDTFADKDKGYDYDAFNSTLDGLLYDNSVVGFNSGYFRTRVNWCEVEIRNIVRSNVDQIIIQVVAGAIKTDNSGKLTASNDGYQILYRKHANSSWGEWKEYAGSSSEVQKITETEILAMGFTKNEGTITGVKMNGVSKGTSGVVDLGTVITEHQDISGKANSKDLAAVATSGSYNDLSNKPTIPSAITENTVAGWGFTKNQGTVTEVKVNGAAKTPVDGIIELPNLTTQDEFGPFKVKLDTVESGANKYVHPNDGEGSNGSYAAFNPETLVGAEKITVPTMTVNRFGHVTSAGINEIALPDFTKYATGITKDDLVAGVVNGVVDISDFFSNIQSKLVSGNNIKTINNQSLLGSGNITIEGGSGGGEVQKTTEAEILAMGFTKNKGTITEVKMNGESKGTSGVVDLGAVITEHQDISGKVDKVDGKQLSTEDFTTALKQKLEALNNYDDTAISEGLASLQQSLNTLLNDNPNDAINSFNEIIAFLQNIEDDQSLAGIIASIEQQIAAKVDKVTLATVATSGNYNDLSNKPTIPSAVTESTVSGWGFTKNTGTYSKPSGGIPKSDLENDVQNSLDKANTALQEHQDISGKQDKLVSGVNIKTINRQSILGEGNINIEGGSGGTSSGGTGWTENNIGSIEGNIRLDPFVHYYGGDISDDCQIEVYTDNGYYLEFDLQFHYSGGTVILPDLLWANGEIPALEEDWFYELSIVYDGGSELIKGVLTKFSA